MTGIEQRAPRVIAPKRWTVYSVLRGVLNPVLDRRTAKHAATQAVVREADQGGHASAAPVQLEAVRRG